MTETPAPLPCPYVGCCCVQIRGQLLCKRCKNVWRARPAAAVTPEAVEAALVAYGDGIMADEPEYRDAMRAALEAAIPHLSPSQGDAAALAELRKRMVERLAAGQPWEDGYYKPFGGGYIVALEVAIEEIDEAVARLDRRERND